MLSTNQDEVTVLFNEIDSQNKVAWESRFSDIRACFNLSSEVLGKAYSVNYLKGIADAERNIGYCYWRMSNYEQSLQHSLKAIEIYQSINDKKGLADALNSLGAVYMFQKRHKDRLDVNMECLRIRTEIQDLEGISASMNNIGETYMEMNDYSNAKIWFEKCIQYPGATISALAWANFNLGKLYFTLQDKSSALRYFEQSEKLAQSLSYYSLLIELYYYFARYYFSENQIDRAIQYTKLSRQFAEKISNKEGIALSCLLLSEIYEFQKDYYSSLQSYKEYSKYREEFLNEVNLHNIQQLNFQYEVEKLRRKAEIEKLRNEELISSYQKIEFEHKELSELFNELRTNMNYAQSIQKSIIQVPEPFIQQYPFHFIMYQPKMIVSGDFVWTYVSTDNRYYYVVLGDCIGHGISAALISMLSISYLNNIIKTISTPDKIVTQLLSNIGQSLYQNSDIVDLISDKTALEIMVIRIDKENQELNYYSTGIESMLFNISSDPIIMNKHYQQTIKINANDILYVYTDGVYDQLGGEKGKRLKRAQWRKFLSSLVLTTPMYAHKEKITQFLNAWKNNEPQTDDITIFALQF